MKRTRARLGGDEDNADDDERDFVSRSLDLKVPLHIYMPGKLTTVFLFYVAMFLSNVIYNYHRGHYEASRRIEDAKALHRSCTNDAVVMTNFFEKCRAASIERNMPAHDLTMDYVLANTDFCIRVSCMHLLTQIIEKTGWLFIGIGFIGVLLLYVALRFWPKQSQYAIEARYDTAGVHDIGVQPYFPMREGERLKEIKAT